MEADAAPGAAMPPADYNYDYAAAYASTDPQQQWWALLAAVA
jgi:hypothetical protein